MTYCQSHAQGRLIPRHTRPRGAWRVWPDTWTDGAQVEGGSEPRPTGYHADLSIASAGVAEEISIPVGAFSKCRLRVFTCTLQTHSDPLSLHWSPINQLPERKTPWPGLILQGQWGPSVEGSRHMRPAFKFTAGTLVVLGNRSVCGLVSVISQSSWEGILSLGVIQPWHFKTMHLVLPINITGGD